MSEEEARRDAANARAKALATHKPNPAIDRCARRFPRSVAERTAKGVTIKDGGRIIGQGSSLARACKDALRRAK